jgi:hypothetical protein
LAQPVNRFGCVSNELAIVEIGVQTLVWKGQSKLWTPSPSPTEMKHTQIKLATVSDNSGTYPNKLASDTQPNFNISKQEKMKR